MVTEKTIQEYSGRQRINILNKDGFYSGEEVVILTKQEYKSLMESIYNFTISLKECHAMIDTLKERPELIEETIEKTLKRVGMC